MNEQQAASRATRETSSGRLIPPVGGAAIRFYRQGTGDCFLLAFAAERKRSPVYLLIDCGVNNTQVGARETMRKVTADIARAAGGHLHHVVVTQRSDDHLSAFLQETHRFLLGDLTIETLWLAWTEDERDALARPLRSAGRWADEALRAAAEKLQADARSDRQTAALADSVGAEFRAQRNEHSPEELAALADRLGVNESRASRADLAIALLRQCAGRVHYLQPREQPFDIPGAAHARAYVLGPPRVDAADAQTGRRSELRVGTYLSSSALAMPLAAALGVQTANPDFGERCRPFDSRYCVSRAELCSNNPPEEVRPTRDFIEEHYGLEGRRSDQAWRRIEHEWLYAFAPLSLHLEEHANNGGLALAFEVGAPGRGPVLLFPGDAQVVSWLSWKSLRFRTGGGEFDISDLFARTLVYKVGQHGGPNATLIRDDQGRDYGLSQMPDGLVALLPVAPSTDDEARKLGLPYPRLYAALKKKTLGNLLSSDDEHDDDLPVPRVRLADVPHQPLVQWRRAKATHELGGALYYDVMIHASD